jgi:MULE transposase domain/Zinc knuckle
MSLGTVEAFFAEDCLPPERNYESRDALFKSINAWAATKGYAFTTGKSKKEKTGKQTVTYACDRSCRPPSASRERQRNTTTRGTGCQFSVLAKESLDKSTWSLRYRPDKRFSLHNHAPSQHPSAHPAHRTLSKEEITTLASLTNAGIAPKDIRTCLRQSGNSMATQQDVYNRIADVRREVCEGQSTIHALANQLDREGFWSRMQFAPDGRVTAVLFAHPDSLAYLQAYPDILLLDCTYKTNKYGMPLLDMIGVDACQRSFCIAFAFLSGETEDDYSWALDRLRSLYEHYSAQLPSIVLTDRCIACMNAVSTCFPSSFSLLCLWHANKAVLRYCLPAFMVRERVASTSRTTSAASETGPWEEFYQSWHSIISSPNEDTFNERVSDFEGTYLPDCLEEVGYIKTYWLDPYKEKLVKAWVDQHTHFGNVATSRVEGIHALLKSHLKKSTLDLFEAWRAMKHALLNQLSELRSNQAKQQVRVPIELSGPLYSAVRGWVSHEALRKVEEQRKLLARKDPPPSPTCNGSFSRVHGLPCLHTLKDLQEQNQVLLLEHFHSHWHLRRDGTPQLLLEPRQRIDPVNRTSNHPKQSTRREPSLFEGVEAAARASSRCSKCHALGHIRTSKACPLRYTEALAATTSEPASQPTTTLDSTLHPNNVPDLDSITVVVISAQLAETTSQPATSPAGTLPPLPDLSPAHTLPPLPDLSPARTSPPLPDPSPWSPPRYDSPQAIYQRYVAARSAWYEAQPRGSIKTNQQYRKAMGLSLRYSKKSYEWCLDYKQMTKRCITSTGSREWTKEEMMAYLDWSEAEDKRIEAQVAQEMEGNPLGRQRRGVGEIWRMIDRDIEEQEALYEGNM